jgi:hypothetical protein
MIATANGSKRWHPPALDPSALCIAGDGSEYGYGAFFPNGEVSDELVVAWSSEQLQLMAESATAFSSTVREALAVEGTLQWLLAHHPARVRDRHVVYKTDSQVL